MMKLGFVGLCTAIVLLLLSVSCKKETKGKVGDACTKTADCGAGLRCDGKLEVCCNGDVCTDRKKQAGSSKSPKDLCKKMFEFMKKERKEKLNQAVVDKLMKKCTDEVETIKKNDAKAYKCYSGCVFDASKMADVDKCEKQCGPK